MNAKQAAEKAMNLGKQFQAVIDVGECLDKIGNLEVATQEAEEAIDKAVMSRAEAENELDQVLAKIQASNQEVKLAKREAVKILTDVNMARNRLLAQAKEEKDKIVGAATKSANESIEAGQTELKMLIGQRDVLLEEIEQLTSELKKLRYEMQVLRERLG